MKNAVTLPLNSQLFWLFGGGGGIRQTKLLLLDYVQSREGPH